MASSTARVLIADALRALGVLASGETPTADEANDALNILNEMLEQWNLESMLVYAIARTVQSTTAAKGTYTLGSGGNWNMTRPDYIERITHYDSAQDLEIPLRRQSERDYQNVRVRGTTSSIPSEWYDNNAYPLRTITLWPVPSVSKQVYLYTWQQLTTVATLDTSLDFPSGYRAAIRANLAVACATDFQQPVTDDLDRVARWSKGIVKRHNIRPEPIHADPAVMAISIKPDTYNWDFQKSGGAQAPPP